MVRPHLGMGIKKGLEMLYYALATAIFLTGAVILFAILTGTKLEKKVFLSVIAIIIVLTMAANADAGQWGKYIEVYAGIDYYNNQSPMCENRPQTNVTYDERGTSNMGFVVNIYSGWLDYSLKGTHFSCVWNRDDHTVNIPGFVVSKRWSR